MRCATRHPQLWYPYAPHACYPTTPPPWQSPQPKVTDSEGRAVEGASGRGPGYRYFGAAKQLPGVKELFEKEAPRQVRSRGGRWGATRGCPGGHRRRDGSGGVAPDDERCDAIGICRPL